MMKPGESKEILKLRDYKPLKKVKVAIKLIHEVQDEVDDMVKEDAVRTINMDIEDSLESLNGLKNNLSYEVKRNERY